MGFSSPFFDNCRRRFFEETSDSLVGLQQGFYFVTQILVSSASMVQEGPSLLNRKLGSFGEEFEDASRVGRHESICGRRETRSRRWPMLDNEHIHLQQRNFAVERPIFQRSLFHQEFPSQACPILP
jgi:hypothetical protein